jgi:tRNA U34 2-thiouridine synthase MnmA/TrmU
VREINWLGDAPFDSRPEWHVAVKIRSTRPPREAVIRPLSATEAEVELIVAEEGVSPGQACVFYSTRTSPRTRLAARNPFHLSVLSPSNSTVRLSGRSCA